MFTYNIFAKKCLRQQIAHFEEKYPYRVVSVEGIDAIWQVKTHAANFCSEIFLVLRRNISIALPNLTNKPYITR